ncbi:MAG: hypothetical protein LBR23_06365, partial [Spirochaetaceae bacterium]|nr:hypothetical protein [Spirochaetaceae bacterium]
ILGDGVKALAPSEAGNYGRTNRSLHYLSALPEGTVLGPGDAAPLRTEKILTPGLPPDFLGWVMGKRLVRDVENGAGVRLDDFVPGQFFS